jgi:hypothetical protein
LKKQKTAATGKKTDANVNEVNVLYASKLLTDDQQRSSVVQDSIDPFSRIPAATKNDGLSHKGGYLQGLVTGAGGVALVVVHYLTVGTQTVRGVETPEDAVIAALDGRVPGGLDVHALPAQIFATVRPDPCQAGTFP